ANIPLMTWYGIEPIVPADAARSIANLPAVDIPIVRRFLARRLVDDGVTQSRKADLGPLLKAAAHMPEAGQLDVLRGIREGLRGTKSLPMPAAWPDIYPRLAAGGAAVRDHAVALALTFGDPRAVGDLRKTVDSPTASLPERTAALQALIDKRPPDLAPVLHQLLSDAKLRATALRGLASNPHPATPATVLAGYPKWSAAEKQEAISTL